MNEQQFMENLPDLLKVLDFAINNPYSDFYRKKYQELTFDPLQINTYEEFKKIPPLTKEEIVSYAPAERIFVPQNQTYYTVTSGTTKTPKPLLVAQLKEKRYSSMDYISNKVVKKLGLNACMLLVPPTSPLFIKVPLTANSYLNIIPADLNRLKASALIAKEAQIDTLISTPTILYYFIQELTPLNFPFTKVKYISLGGEATSLLKLNHFKKIFPNAKFDFKYGAAEIDSLRGIACPLVTESRPNYFHPNKDHFLEIKANDDFKIEGSGEILHTDLKTPAAFPLIRYLTKDFAEIGKKKCRCGEVNYLLLDGKIGSDVVRFLGTTFYSDSFDKILLQFKNDIEPLFEVYLTENKSRGKLRGQIKIILFTKEKSAKRNLINKITDHIVNELHLAPEKNLSFFITNGLFDPPIIELRGKSDFTGTKTNKIFIE